MSNQAEKIIEILENDFSVFVVMNSKNEFFRAKGFVGAGKSWIDDIKKATIYSNIKYARSIVTHHASHDSTPIILQIFAGNHEVIDEKDRVEKVLDKKKIAREAADFKRKQQALENAKRNLKIAQEKLKAAKQTTMKKNK